MESKLLSIVLLLTNYISIVLSQDIIVATNYTRGFFTELEEKIECHFDDECPEFTKCKNDHCTYLDLLCFENKESKCSFLNTTLWKDRDEVLSNPFSTTPTKPIIKSCPVELIENKRCQTDLCVKDEDCFSGSCISQYCASKETVYLCNGTDETETKPVQCGKYHHMKCKNDDECVSPFKCKDGYCESYWYKSSYHRPNWKYIVLWCVLGVLLVLILIYAIWLIRKKCQNKKIEKEKSDIIVGNSTKV